MFSQQTIQASTEKRIQTNNNSYSFVVDHKQLNQKRQVKLKTCADVYDYWRTCKRLYKKAPKDGVEFQVDYIDTGLALDEEVRSKAPITLALHGAPGSYHDFALLIHHLSQQNVRVIAPNFPEYIATVKTKVLFRHSADEKAAYLRDFLKAINVNKIDLLVSHSSAIFPTLLILLNANQLAIKEQQEQKSTSTNVNQRHSLQHQKQRHRQDEKTGLGDNINEGEKVNEKIFKNNHVKFNDDQLVFNQSKQAGDDETEQKPLSKFTQDEEETYEEEEDLYEEFEDANDEIVDDNNNNNNSNNKNNNPVATGVDNKKALNQTTKIMTSKVKQIDEAQVDNNVLVYEETTNTELRSRSKKLRGKRKNMDVIVRFEEPIEIKAVALLNPAGHRLPKSMKPTWFKCGSVRVYQHKLGRSLFRKLGPAFLTVVGVPVRVDNMDNVMLSATVMRNSKCQRVVKQLEQLSQMKLPTLLVFSENDKLIEKEIFYEMSRFMRLDQKNFDIFNNEGDIELSQSNREDWIRVMVFKAGGHYAYSNYAETVNKAVSELLNKVVNRDTREHPISKIASC